MKPRKSLDLKFPYVPREFLRDFIRGVFDGDGCVYYPKEHRLSTSFSGASRDFIYRLEVTLSSLGMPRKKISQSRYKNIHYSLRYGHKDSLVFFDLIYFNIENQLYLKRKYDKFKAVINYGKST